MSGAVEQRKTAATPETCEISLHRRSSAGLFVNAPGETRTPNPQIRSLVLYPIELRARAEKRAGSKGGNNYSTGP